MITSHIVKVRIAIFFSKMNITTRRKILDRRRRRRIHTKYPPTDPDSLFSGIPEAHSARAKKVQGCAKGVQFWEQSVDCGERSTRHHLERRKNRDLTFLNEERQRVALVPGRNPAMRDGGRGNEADEPWKIQPVCSNDDNSIAS